jgi:hypothetical protein
VARIHGQFREGFELEHFPFDRQWLTSRFTSRFEDVRFVKEWPEEEWGPQVVGTSEEELKTKLEKVKDKDIVRVPYNKAIEMLFKGPDPLTWGRKLQLRHESAIQKSEDTEVIVENYKFTQPDHLADETFILDEWELGRAVCVQARASFASKSFHKKTYHELNVKLAVKRKSAFYVLNIMMLNAVLVVMAFTVLLVPAEEFADRMSVSMTILLTNVAFKQFITNHVPPISSSTYLDNFVLWGFALQCVIILQNAVSVVITMDPHIGIVQTVVDEVDGSAVWFDVLSAIVLGLLTLVYLAYFAKVAHERVYKKSLPAFFDRFEREDKKERYDWHRLGPKPWRPTKKPGPCGRLLQALKIRSPSSPSTTPLL